MENCRWLEKQLIENDVPQTHAESSSPHDRPPHEQEQPRPLLSQNMPQHEQNDDMLQHISKDLMAKRNDANHGCDVVLALHGAINHIVFSYEPTRTKGHDELIETMHDANLLGRPQVAEIYSPPRVTSLAHRYNLPPGFALDLTIIDEDDGEPWNFDDAGKRERARRLMRTSKPWLLIGSPRCTGFSVIQNLNRDRMEAWKWDAPRAHGLRHVEF